MSISTCSAELPRARCCRRRLLTSAAAVLPGASAWCLHLLTAGKYLNEREFPHAAVQRLQQLWQSLHVRLAEQSTSAAHRLVPDRGHFMQREQPDVIAAVILDLPTEIA